MSPDGASKRSLRVVEMFEARGSSHGTNIRHLTRERGDADVLPWPDVHLAHPICAYPALEICADSPSPRPGRMPGEMKAKGERGSPSVSGNGDARGYWDFTARTRRDDHAGDASIACVR